MLLKQEVGAGEIKANQAYLIFKSKYNDQTINQDNFQIEMKQMDSFGFAKNITERPNAQKMIVLRI